MSYRVDVPRHVAKQIAGLAPGLRRRIDARIATLSEDPRPFGSTALSGRHRGLHRVRVGDYRIIYGVDDRARAVRISAVGPRDSVYQ